MVWGFALHVSKFPLSRRFNDIVPVKCVMASDVKADNRYRNSLCDIILTSANANVRSESKGVAPN